MALKSSPDILAPLPDLITPFLANIFSNKLALDIPNGIPKNLIRYSLASFSTVSVTSFLKELEFSETISVISSISWFEILWFIGDFNLLSCESDNSEFKLFFSVVFYLFYFKAKINSWNVFWYPVSPCRTSKIVSFTS